MLTKLIQVVLLLCFTIHCCSAKVSSIVVFGDSYSGKVNCRGVGREGWAQEVLILLPLKIDVGNGQLSSNGPLWSQDLAVGWNASLYSFAFSGATCDRSLYHAKTSNNGSSSSSASAPPSIVDQLEMYYKQQLGLTPEDTIYAFWVGHTDIYDMVQANNKGIVIVLRLSCHFTLSCLFARLRCSCRLHHSANGKQ